MLGFLVDNIYVVFGHQVLQQSVCIPMDTNCAPLLADVFLYELNIFYCIYLYTKGLVTSSNNLEIPYSYIHKAEFVQKLLQDNNKNSVTLKTP
jgi:hypothetical protein